MNKRFTRRRLVAASLIGVPYLAACSQGERAVVQEPAATSAPVEQAPVAATTPEPAAAAQSAVAAEPSGAAAARPKTIILDPGHGGDEIGAASAIAGLPNLLEKDSNLAFAKRLRELLETDGYRVLMTRETDGRAPGFTRPDQAAISSAGTPEGLTVSRSDLQARVDFANESRGDLFLSLHSNDSGSLDENGVEVWYCDDREVGQRNSIWAQIVLEHVLDALRGYGYPATNRGTKEDRYFRVRNGRNFHIFVLGPPNPEARHPRATMMPAALVENLFMRHARDQWVLRDPAAREAITQGMRQAVHRFFEWQDG